MSLIRADHPVAITRILRPKALAGFGPITPTFRQGGWRHSNTLEPRLGRVAGAGLEGALDEAWIRCEIVDGAAATGDEGGNARERMDEGDG